MKGSELDNAVAPLLDRSLESHASSCNACGCHCHKRKIRGPDSVRVDSFCLARNERRVPESSILHVQSFQSTVRALQLDHSHSHWSMVSWIVGLLLVVIVPALRLYFVKALSRNPQHALVFQPLVVVVGIALSMISFLFLSQAIRRHGLRGVLFLDAAEEEVMEVQNEYNAIIEELKMKIFKDLLGKGLNPEFYYYKYLRIIIGLQATSRRFRSFLALIVAVSIIGFLASMYKVVEAERAGIDKLMAGEIVVLNTVNLTGVGLCLRSASKLSHLHRRIVKDAASVHAIETFEAAGCDTICNLEKDSVLGQLGRFCRSQDSWSQRAALVNFLASSSPGISVYGFVLDRFFVHTSVGALLATTWFILGRSLST